MINGKGLEIVEEIFICILQYESKVHYIFVIDNCTVVEDKVIKMSS